MDTNRTSSEKIRKIQKVRSDKGTHRRRKEFELYGLFLAVTLKERQEQFGFYTDQEFARTHRINAGTLSEWKRDMKLWEIRDKNMNALKQFTAQVLEGVRNRAATGEKTGAADARLWLEFVERWRPGVSINVDAGEDEDRERYTSSEEKDQEEFA